MALISVSGRARDSTLVTELFYEVSNNSGASYGPIQNIPIPSHNPAEWFNWSFVVDLPVGEYIVRVTAENGENAVRVDTVEFSVISPSDIVTGFSIESWDSPGADAGSDSRVGYRFTVGLQPIEATALELYWHPDADQPERLMLHDSSGTALATIEANRSGSGGAWQSYPLSPAIDLEPGETYTVSTARPDTFGRQIYINPVNPVFSGGIEDVTVVYGPATNARPTSEFTDPQWAEDYMFMRVRFG